MSQCKEAAALPAKKIGSAEEAAQAVLCLMTNDFMSGEVLHLDGGGRLVGWTSPLLRVGPERLEVLHRPSLDGSIAPDVAPLPEP